ncbi:hypothetical protein MNBD_ALPHA11-1604 [hydrothermal vent metagenome]|uniref:DUF2306 domain-containing protein n=1 Tax=hydrothermal vent metagenome TaxID=652676 RepID=A0A3B0UF33_9ZZZZ
MNLSVLLEANIAILIHAVAAMIAVLLGAIILFGKKGDNFHIYLGRIWSVSMVMVIVSSAFISELRIWGPFSPIHIFTVLGAVGLAQGIYYIRIGNINAHKASMRNLYYWGLGVAGTFAFMPGRVMNAMFFPNDPLSGFYLILAAFLIVMGFRSRTGKGFIFRLQSEYFGRKN